MSLLDFSPRIPLGTFSILLYYKSAWHYLKSSVKCWCFKTTIPWRFLVITVLVRCWCLDRHVYVKKNLTKFLLRMEPDRLNNFFFSPPAHLSVTYITESWLHVTLKLMWYIIYYWRREPHISFSKPWSKTGYWLSVCHGWFHLHWLTRAGRSENRELQDKKLLPKVRFELKNPESQV